MEKKRIAFTAGLLVAAVALSISLVTAKKSMRPSQDIEQTTFQVANLSCGSCLAVIEEELRRYDGMVAIKADLGRGLVTVGHTGELAGPRIAEAITLAGYPARAITEQEAQALQAATRAEGYGGSGCGSRGCGTGGGYGTGCKVTASAWKELYRRLVGRLQ